MATKQQREEHTRTLLMLSGMAREAGKDISQAEISADLDWLHRQEAALHRIAENDCNGHPKEVIEHRKNPDGTTSTFRYSEENTEWAERDAKKEARIQERVRKLAEKYGLTVKFNGDPRGGAIRFVMLDGRSNGFVNDGTWGIYW